ncbi:MAG TPA: CLC_0170 family protein [Symbiobacteriaceae bacterium]|nr:CLC_0170 family protein [Symbiobacteriaceae bacterium]
MKAVVNMMSGTFSGMAYALTLLSGLLTITVERYLFRRRNYKREAKLTAVIGWTYVVGGTVLYLLLSVLVRLM